MLKQVLFFALALFLALTTASDAGERNPDEISCEEVANLLASGETNYRIIDLRSDDYVGFKIRGSQHMPSNALISRKAQAALAKELIASGIELVIFHCKFCQGRGPIMTRLFKGYFEKEKIENIKVKFVQGGIMGFVAFAQEKYPDSNLIEPIPK